MKNLKFQKWRYKSDGQIKSEEVLNKLKEIQEVAEYTVYQKKNFTVTTTSDEGVSYTHDRKSFLCHGLEYTADKLREVIEEIEKRA